MACPAVSSFPNSVLAADRRACADARTGRRSCTDRYLPKQSSGTREEKQNSGLAARLASQCVRESGGVRFSRYRTKMKLEPLHPVQIYRFRQMTPVEKWDVALGLLRTARETRRAALRERNPNLTETEIEGALAKELRCART